MSKGMALLSPTRGATEGETETRSSTMRKSSHSANTKRISNVRPQRHGPTMDLPEFSFFTHDKELLRERHDTAANAPVKMIEVPSPISDAVNGSTIASKQRMVETAPVTVVIAPRAPAPALDLNADLSYPPSPAFMPTTDTPSSSLVGAARMAMTMSPATRLPSHQKKTALVKAQKREQNDNFDNWKDEGGGDGPASFADPGLSHYRDVQSTNMKTDSLAFSHGHDMESWTNEMDWDELEKEQGMTEKECLLSGMHWDNRASRPEFAGRETNSQESGARSSTQYPGMVQIPAPALDFEVVYDAFYQNTRNSHHANSVDGDKSQDTDTQDGGCRMHIWICFFCIICLLLAIGTILVGLFAFDEFSQAVLGRQNTSTEAPSSSTPSSPPISWPNSKEDFAPNPLETPLKTPSAAQSTNETTAAAAAISDEEMALAILNTTTASTSTSTPSPILSLSLNSSLQSPNPTKAPSVQPSPIPGPPTEGPPSTPLTSWSTPTAVTNSPTPELTTAPPTPLPTPVHTTNSSTPWWSIPGVTRRVTIKNILISTGDQWDAVDTEWILPSITIGGVEFLPKSCYLSRLCSTFTQVSKNSLIGFPDLYNWFYACDNFGGPCSGNTGVLVGGDWELRIRVKENDGFDGLVPVPYDSVDFAWTIPAQELSKPRQKWESSEQLTTNENGSAYKWQFEIVEV